MIDSVLLIRPYSISKKEFPLGLLYIGTALKNKGYSVKIVDLQDDPAQEDKIIETVKKSPNIIVGITGLALHYRWIKQFSLKLKKASAKTKIVVGGHVTPVYELILQNTGVDYVCTGEGEEMFPELIDKLNSNQPVGTIFGLAYRNSDNKIVKTGFRPLLKSFITPDYSLIDIEKYLIHPTKDFFFKNSPEYRAREKKEDKLGVIMFSRGCVGGCNFCYRHLPGFRQASVDWSWNHLTLLYNKYGVRYFRVDDELFVNDIEWFEVLYKKFTDSKLDILFRITGLRVDLINDDLLGKLKNMGCIAINYGIESGSQTILDNMNKRTTVMQNLNAINKTLGHGMQAMAYTMIGFLGENKRTLKDTLNMLLDSGLKREYIDIFYAVALPGTKLYKDAIKFGKISNEEEYLIGMAPYVEESKPASERYILNFSEIEIKELVRWERNLGVLIRLKEKLLKFPTIFKFSKGIFAGILNNDYLYNILHGIAKILKKLSFA